MYSLPQWYRLYHRRHKGLVSIRIEPALQSNVCRWIRSTQSGFIRFIFVSKTRTHTPVVLAVALVVTWPVSAGAGGGVSTGIRVTRYMATCYCGEHIAKKKNKRRKIKECGEVHMSWTGGRATIRVDIIGTQEGKFWGRRLSAIL